MDIYVKDPESPNKGFLPQDVFQKANLFRTVLQERKDWLLIFDNADDIKIEYTTYMPLDLYDHKGHILLTSRTSQLSRLLKNTIEIQVGRLPDGEALDMFLAIADRANLAKEYLGDKLVPELIVKELENFPLAIVQAASFLRCHTPISGAEYIESLKDQAERPMLLRLSINYENYNKTVMTTWEVSYTNLFQDKTTASAAQLLSLLGFLDLAGVPEIYLHDVHALKYDLLNINLPAISTRTKDSMDLKTSVDTLISLSLVHRSEQYSRQYGQTSFLSLHPLVHEWIRVRLHQVQDGRIHRDELIELSNALALHQMHQDSIKEEWEYSRKKENFGFFREGPSPQSVTILRTREAMADMQTLGIGTILLLCADILYRQWTRVSKPEQLSPNDTFDISGGQRQATETKVGKYGNFPDHLFNLETLGSLISEPWYPFSSVSNDSWAVIGKFSGMSNNHTLKLYTDCLLLGLHCLRALGKEIGVIPPTALQSIPRPCGHSPSLLTPSIAASAKLNVLLEEFSQSHPVSHLFFQWNRSHDTLPHVSEDTEACLWYTHFHHSHSILLAAINGLLWPQYLRLNLYPNLDGGFTPQALDAYYALEEPNTAKAWEWEARCRAVAGYTMEDSAYTLLPIRFSRLYKAGRIFEAEQAVLGVIDTNNLYIHEVKPAYVVLITESMLLRGAYNECKQFLVSYALEYFGSYEWDVQWAVDRMCLSMFIRKGSDEIEAVEEMLIFYIVAVVPYAASKKWARDVLMFLREMSAPAHSAEVLGQIYMNCELYGEAATLLSWAMDFNGSSRDTEPIRCLLTCQRKLGLITEEIFDEFYEELDKPPELGRRKYGTVDRGIWAVYYDGRFEDGCQQIRDAERTNQGVKKRFHNCLKRNSRSDFDDVDAVWETMLVEKSPSLRKWKDARQHTATV